MIRILVGLIPTFCILKFEPGTINPADRRNAAADISPGTKNFFPSIFIPGFTSIILELSLDDDFNPSIRSV